MNPTLPELTDAPWWRHPLLWMVIAGPALVVVASIATFWLALANPDALVPPDRDRARGGADRVAVDKQAMPALAGRNHAVTPADRVPGPPAGKASP